MQLPKGFVPLQTIDGSRSVVLPGPDGKRVEVVYAHAGPLADKIAKNGSVELGPRHTTSVSAWKGVRALEEAAKAPAKKAAPAKAAAKKVAAKAPAATEQGHRGRGRPRNDGLLPGSEAVGMLKQAHATKTPVPDEVLVLMSPEARLVEEARNARLRGETVPGKRRAVTTKAAPAAKAEPVKKAAPKAPSKVTPITQARKAAAKKVAASAPGRRVIRRRAAAPTS